MKITMSRTATLTTTHIDFFKTSKNEKVHLSNYELSTM